jgi:uncharacterized protein (TIGR00255 family)
MTGFGRAHVQTERYVVSAEVRAVNNRGLRVTLRLPERVQGLESELEKAVRKVAARGTLSVLIAIDDTEAESAYVLDPAVIRYYRNAFAELAKELDLPAEPSLEAIAALPGAITKRKSLDGIPDELAGAVRQALNDALAELAATREREGAFIWEDVTTRSQSMAGLLDRVQERLPLMLEEYRQRLAERLSKLLEPVGASLNESDLQRELALFASRSDIAEEMSRLRSHLTMLTEARPGGDPFGRRFEFIAQEMFREANTMAAKANDTQTVQHILDIKAEIEKLREQALNVE